MNTPAILQQLQRANPGLQAIRQMAATVRGASNPQAMLDMMAQSNPQIRQAMELIKNSGGSPERAFYAACQQRGVDPKEVMDMLK